MRAARFVTLCFLYSGLIYLLQSVVVYHIRFDLESLAHLGIAISIFGAGFVRLVYSDEEADNPAEYGLFAYGMAGLAVLLTGIFLIQLFFI